jgi:alpha-tubulin suppressor-like RCC1 family protein
MFGVAVMMAAVLAGPAAAQSAEIQIVHLTAGSGHTCGLSSEGMAYCWGRAAEGQLGDGRTTYRSGPVAVLTPAGVSFTQLTAGQGHTCGLGSDSKTYCWGFNDRGQLGDGSTSNRSAPVAVNTPAGVSFTGLSAGDRNTCGLGSDGKTYCWGTNDHGQLGDGGAAPRPTPGAVNMPAGVSFTQLSGGAYHTCALGNDAKTYCWGMGGNGQLGDGANTTRSSPVVATAPAGVSFTQLAVGSFHTCARGSDNKSYCWGLNENGPLGNGATANTSGLVEVISPAGVSFTHLVAGTIHTCGLGSDAKTYCWGYGRYGQLGNGDTANRLTPAPIIAPAGVTFTGLIAGWYHTCGLGSDTKTYCWGLNETSQLGDSGTMDRSTPIAVPLTSSPAGPQPPASPVVPQPPTGVTVTAGGQQITLSWAAPSDLGNGTLTGYTATTSPGGNSCSTVSTTCTIAGLADGIPYTITMVTTTTAGVSTVSNLYAGPPSRI